MLKYNLVVYFDNLDNMHVPKHLFLKSEFLLNIHKLLLLELMGYLDLQLKLLLIFHFYLQQAKPIQNQILLPQLLKILL